MKAIEAIDLSKVLRLVAKPKYVLGTTYTLSLAFFESAIFPIINRSKLKSCLILCDSIGYYNALTEAAALQSAAQDYMVVPAPVPGSFHAKVWVIVGDGEAVLLTGSGNLTQAGFMTNAEFFDALHFTAESPASPSLISDVSSFVKGLATMWRAEDGQHLHCVETLSHIEQAIADLPVSPDEDENGPRLLHSFRGSLIQQMPAVRDANELYIAAPYFGGSLQGVKLLADRYSTAKLNIFPAVHGGKLTDIPLDDLAQSHKNARVLQLVVPAKKALAHLKLYAVTKGSDQALLFCTSANCNQAAWQGPNIEAGLLRTVPHPVVKDYFVANNAQLPKDRLKIQSTNDSSDILHCWAVDTGAGLDLRVSNDDRPRLPLRDVTLATRAGSDLAACEKTTLFQNSCFEYLAWTSFEGWQRRRKVALCLDVQGFDVKGRPVRAGCLVENRLLLTADPVHRSAWRGALALLDAEGVPELGDIAAIFALASDMFDGNLTDLAATNSSDGPSGSKPENQKENPAIAIWPPQPDTHELRKRMGASAQGQLQWFQHILKSLLQNDPAIDVCNEPALGGNDHLDDEQDDHKTRNNGRDYARNEKNIERALKTAQRIWDQAFKDYLRLREKLTELCPTADKAPNIWPAAIFSFLSTMAVLRSAKRMAPDIRVETSAEILCDDFLRAMFNPRPQHDDFCCPRGFRYRSEKFPPLAEDLCSHFKLKLHPDLAMVVLALMIDKRMRNPLPLASPARRNLQLDLICDSTFVADTDTRDACRRIWRRYIRDRSRKSADADFDKDFNALFNIPSERTTS